MERIDSAASGSGPSGRTERSRSRRVITSIGLAVGIACLAVVLFEMSNPRLTPPDDFVAFWSAARLFVAGENPYDADALLRIQRTANWIKDHAYRVWEPPWALVVLSPLAPLPYQTGRFAWFVLNLALVVAAGDALWRYYGGAVARRGVGWMLAITFTPAILAWKTGQLTILVLTGIVAFLVLERRGRAVAAVVTLLALGGLKPHVIHLVWLAVAAWIARTRRWPVAWAGLAAGCVIVLAPLARSSAVAADFVRAFLDTPPTQPSPTLGTLLRLIASTWRGHDVYPLAFAPPFIGLWWLARHRSDALRWDTAMPALLLVSFVTSPFAWPYDAVVLLVPVMRVLTRVASSPRPSPRWIPWTYGGINLLAFGQNVWLVEPFWYVWLGPALLLWYWRADRTFDRT
jgi:hypothetical protein